MKASVLEHKSAQPVPFPEVSFEHLPIYDRRFFPRWELDQKAYYRLKNHNVIYRTQVKNLTLNGACLYLDCGIHPLQRVAIKIYLPDQESFETEGTLIWKRTLPEGLCYGGIFFDRLTAASQSLIMKHAFIPNETVLRN